MADHQTELIKMLLVLVVIIGLTVVVLRNAPTQWIEAKDGDFQQAFLANVGKQDDSVWSFPMKETLSRIVTAWWEKKCGGVILKHDNDDQAYQVIEFKRGMAGPSKMDGVPAIGVRWTRTSTLQQAKTFLRLYPRVETISCSDETFTTFAKHMTTYCRGDKLDVTIGAPVYEGYLSSITR